MLTSRSPKQFGCASSFVNHYRIARSAVMNGVTIPAKTAAILEARGVNLGELEARILQNMEFRR